VTVDVALYGHWICPFSTRVEFALHQRGIEHQVVDVPPSAVRGPDFMLPPEFVEHSPRLEIPMVRVGGEHRADSIPILEWLETRFADRSLLPDTDGDRSVVRERMEWIDRHAFRPMIGVYYGVDADRIEAAGAALLDALGEMGRWASDEGWLGGDRVTLAEAVAVPIHVRMAGLRQLGFVADLPPDWVAHGERCRALAGWPSVEWSAEQTEEFVGRFRAFRRRRRSEP